MLNVLIGLSFLYFVLCLIVSAIVEGISQWRKFRPKILKLATERIIYNQSTIKKDEANSSNLVDDFFNHDLIQSLKGSEDRNPSYIPTNVYSTVLLETLAKGMTITNIKNSPLEFRKSIESLDDNLSGIKKTILRIYDESQGDIDKVIQGIEKLVSDVRDRASGWLKRKQMIYIIGVSSLIVILINADSVSIFNKLSKDKDLQKTIISKVEVFDNQSYRDAICGKSITHKTKPTATTDKTAVTDKSAEADKNAETNKADCPELAVTKSYVLDISPLLGWQSDENLFAKDKTNHDSCFIYVLKVFVKLVIKFLGFALTVGAILMGAPFWYDTIQKLLKAKALVTGKDQNNAPNDSTKPNESSQNNSSSENQSAPTNNNYKQALGPVFNPLATKLSYENAFWLAQFAKWAYLSPTDASAICKQEGYESIPDGLIRVSGSRDTQYLIAHNEKVIVLAFRGSEQNVQDWYGDFEFEKLYWDDNNKTLGQVHKGFRLDYDSVKAELIKSIQSLINTSNRPIWITGHSLGGALAVLASYEFASSGLPVSGTYTFGQPCCSDQSFAKELNKKLLGKYWRVVNNCDVVAKVPPSSMEYQHVGTLLYIDLLSNIKVDPPFWYSLADNFVIPSSREEFLKYLHQFADDHLIDCYIKLINENYSRSI